MTKRVLVTGALGFVGGGVARYFYARGYEVTGVGRGELDPRKLKDAGLSRWIMGDVSAETLAACGPQDLIVHCAGGSTVRASNLDPARDFTNSVTAFNLVLDYVRKTRPTVRLVYVSSAAVYGEGHAQAIAEGDALHPASPYGFHKAMCEEMLKFYGARDGIHGVIIRLFSIYGSGLRKQLLWDAVGKLLNGPPVFFGTGNEVRDWVHIADAVRLIAVAADRATPDIPVCNGASQMAVRVSDVLRFMADILGSDLTPSFDGVRRPGDPEFLVGDARAAKSWGWQPEVDWKTGIAAYARWARGASGF